MKHYQPLRKKSRRRHFKGWKGFTLIEVLILVVVIGIAAAIATPSFMSMMDSIKLKQAVTEVRTGLQETQRQAIRTNQVCNTQLSQGQGSSQGENVNDDVRKRRRMEGTCLTTGNRTLPENVELTSNLQPISTSSSGYSGSPAVEPEEQLVQLSFNHLGSADFSVLTAVRPPDLPVDASAKVITYIPANSKLEKTCISVSNILGLSRVGKYQGELVPTAITDQGICTVLDWTKQ